MDAIVEKLPPWIFDGNDPGYLTVSTWSDNGKVMWQACYMDCHGYALHNTFNNGRSPEEALLNLKETIDLMYRLRGVIDEIVER